MLNNKYNHILSIAIILILLTSLSLELFFNIKPCPLCLIQRMLWLLTLLCQFINIKILTIFSLLANIGVSGYQSLNQYIFKQDSCIISFDPYSSCNNFDFYILNIPISLALCNMIIALCAFSYYGYFNKIRLI